MNVVAVPVAIMAGITFYVGSYHLVIYLRRTQHRENLTFALMCFVVGLYDVFCTGLYNVTSATAGVQWQRAQSIALVLASITFLWFVADYTSKTVPWINRAFVLFFVVILIIIAVERSGLTWTDHPSIKQVQLPFGLGITYYEMASGPITDFLGLWGLVLFTYAAGVTVRLYRSGQRKKAGPLLLALALFFIGVFNDSAVASGLYQFVYALEYSYMALILLMSHSLTTFVVEAAVVKEALRESEEKYRNLVDLGPDPVVLLQDGVCRFVSPAFTDLFGYTAEEVTRGLSFLTLVQEQDQEAVNRQYERRLAGEPVPKTFQVDLIASDGRIVPCETASSLIQYKGRPADLVIIRDISERRQAEAEILRLQHLLQNIADSMPSVLITLDPDGKVLTWNPVAEGLTGQAMAQVEGRLLWQACPELDHYRTLFDQVMEERRVVHHHKESLDSEAGVIYRDVSIFPLLANEIEGAVLRIDDVTRRVQLEEMMLQSAKMASVGGLAAGIAHEINNPLGAMMQSAQVMQMAFDITRSRTRQRLQDSGVDPEGLAQYLEERSIIEYLEGIRAAGQRASKIVSDLLSFSRKTASKVAPNDLNRLVEQALELAAADYDLRKKYDFRNVEVVRELDPDLPEVICDGQQIQQVVLNLVQNAAYAMMGGAEVVGEPPRLVLRTSRHNGWVRLEVEDNGPGVSEADRDRLFEPFYTTKQVGEGTGLGLWLCWSIVVERHGGRIWAEPGRETGACLVVELPVSSGLDD